MGDKLRVMAPPFVVAPPVGASVRTRLRLSSEDAQLLRELGSLLGGLASSDLAARCGQGVLSTSGMVNSRRERKRQLTAVCSSRWAGAITRTSEDAWQLGWRNLEGAAATLHIRIRIVRRRLAVPCGSFQAGTRGYPNPAERFQAQRHLHVLESRLSKIENRLSEGHVSICRGGRVLARQRHQFEATDTSVEDWREVWETGRWFLTADGEAAKKLGNETIRWYPEEGWLEVKLPRALSYRANRPHGRYRLSAPVRFSYRGDDVAAQAATGAVRYDVHFCCKKRRWYLDASWKTAPGPSRSLTELRQHPVLAVDVNAGHLAAVVVDRFGNPVGVPVTVALELTGYPASTRDGRLRAALSRLLGLAEAAGCSAVVIENLNFEAARTEGKDHRGRRPARGRRGRSQRRLLAGIPTSRLRNRLVQMATNRNMAVVAVDPAYTSRWGAQYWLAAMRQLSAEATGHHAAAVVIGRRGLGQRPRRRERCDWNRPEDRRQRATNSAVRAAPDDSGLPESPPGNPEPARPKGSHGVRPKRPTGTYRVTRQPTTVRGRPPPEHQPC